MLERLGRAMARRHRWVLVAWVLVVLVVATAAGRWGGQPVDSFSIPGTGSQRAIDLLDDRFPAAAGASATVVFRAPSGTLTDGAPKAAVEASVAALRAVPEVTSVVDPFAPTASGYVSRQGTIAYTTVSFAEAVADLPETTFDAMESATAPARAAGLQVAYSGGVVDAEDTSASTGGISEHADEIGLGIAVIILLISLGSAVAMALPIGTALVALSVSTSLLTLAEARVDVGTAAGPVGVMIGLGVGIDYSLFVVSRFRQERQAGRSIDEAVGVAVGNAGSAVLFAGLSVCIALTGLWLVGIPYVTTLGLSAAMFVLVAVSAALTLLPALLGAAGGHIDAGSIHRHRGADGGGAGSGRAAARWAQLVARHAVVFTVLALVVLGAMAAPTVRMELGFPDDGDDPPEATQHVAYDLLEEGFGPGVNGPLLVAVTLGPASDAATTGSTGTSAPATTPTTSPTTRPPAATGAAGDGATTATTAPASVSPEEVTQLLDLEEAVAPVLKAIAADPDVASVSPLLPNADGTAGIISVTPRTGPSDPATAELVRRLRDDVLPTAVVGTPLAGQEVAVGGATATLIDLTDLIASRLALVILGVIAGAFVLLMMVFRSVLVPATAAVMNLLSIGAAYGVLVAVFQWGWGKEAIALDETIPVAPFIPVMMFAILFGLSMDYEVFLLSRIREAWLRTGDGRASVAEGLSQTARVITSAALIMISVFLAFVTNPNPVVKMIGFGMAVAVLVDATIVRMLLVPAVMELFGKANWWMPTWLDRALPHIALEGGDAEGEPSTADPGA